MTTHRTAAMLGVALTLALAMVTATPALAIFYTTHENGDGSRTYSGIDESGGPLYGESRENGDGSTSHYWIDSDGPHFGISKDNGDGSQTFSGH